MSYIDIAGRRFGKLTVLSRGYHEKSGTVEWLCRCDCGTEKVIPSGSLRQGRTKSCGCTATKGRRKDIVGNKYGKLTVLEFHSMNANRTSNWLCQCECGNQVVVRRSNLPITDSNLEQKTYSCGCQKAAAQFKRLSKHGEAKKRTKEYACWVNMNQRCYNPKHQRYKSYGAKGVTVCEPWRSNFEQFLEDVGRCPPDKNCIDRIDPYGNYEPSNIRWVTEEVSNMNKRE